jgi:hypothetical protein
MRTRKKRKNKHGAREKRKHGAKSMKIQDIISIILFSIRISLNVLAAWTTLGWKVRKTRKAFEKQLIRQGMSKKDAQRLSAQYAKMKDEIMRGIRQSFVRRI